MTWGVWRAAGEKDRDRKTERVRERQKDRERVGVPDEEILKSAF